MTSERSVKTMTHQETHPSRRMLRLLATTLAAAAALAAATLSQGVLAHVKPALVSSLDTKYGLQSQRLNPNRDLYLFTSSDGQSDAQILSELKTDPRVSGATLNTVIRLNGQSSASVLNGQSSASVLNGQSSASVLNGESSILEQSSASVL